MLRGPRLLACTVHVFLSVSTVCSFVLLKILDHEYVYNLILIVFLKDAFLDMSAESLIALVV